MLTTSSDLSLLNLVAHEMRAPVTLIEGYLSMMRQGELAGNALEEALRVVDVKARELDALAELLVTAAQLESGETLHQPIVFDLHEAVRTAAERLEPRAQLDGAIIQVLEADAALRVYADRCQVARVITNLLHNAVAYSPPSARIEIEVRARHAAEVAVIDHGFGIPLECQQRIFERFSRFGAAGPMRASGLGLGLPLSRDLAELNGGELVLERSVPGHGSVFAFRLPIVK